MCGAGGFDYESSAEYVAEEEYSKIMRRGLPARDDILFTTEAPMGNVALVDRGGHCIGTEGHPLSDESKAL